MLLIRVPTPQPERKRNLVTTHPTLIRTAATQTSKKVRVLQSETIQKPKPHPPVPHISTCYRAEGATHRTHTHHTQCIMFHHPKTLAPFDFLQLRNIILKHFHTLYRNFVQKIAVLPLKSKLHMKQCRHTHQQTICIYMPHHTTPPQCTAI